MARRISRLTKLMRRWTGSADAPSAVQPTNISFATTTRWFGEALTVSETCAPTPFGTAETAGAPALPWSTTRIFSFAEALGFGGAGKTKL
jgi:hypothetical protein